MKYFLFLLDPDGGPISHPTMQQYERLPIRRGMAFRWLRAGPGMVLVCGDDLETAMPIARHGAWTVVGDVRLDNRVGLLGQADATRAGVSDLEVVLHYVAQYGPEAIRKILGDFCFVAWNGITRSGFAARDAMGVKRIYHARSAGVQAFGNRAEGLATGAAYDTAYLTALVADSEPSPDATPYAEVSALPAASIAVLEDGRTAVRRYWSPYDYVSARPGATDVGRLAEEGRELLTTSVRLRLTGRDDTWAQLSGGMDSSSIVSLSQWMAERGEVAAGLTGTVTYVDHHGSAADERRYSNAVIERFGIRNEVVVDKGPWHDSGDVPPNTDFPTSVYPLYARELELCAVVRSSGGRVLLTGNGGDQLFMGNMFFFADWAVTGRLVMAIKEMLSRAATGRVSFWELAYRNMILPLLPNPIQRILLRDRSCAQAWITAEVRRRHLVPERSLSTTVYAGRRGWKYADAIASSVEATPAAIYLGVLDDSLDVRHPFLYRPLVEFALSLAPEVNVQPHARKRVLRESMRGILPDLVRQRIGKGSLAGPSAWSLIGRQKSLDALMEDSMLAQLGIIDPSRLHAAFAALRSAPARTERLRSAVHQTLGIEAWLRARSGRWQTRAHPGLAISSSQPALA